MIYLDNAATTPVRREVLEAMWPHLTGEFGNPSSHHALGDSAARSLADARARVARWFGARPGEVTFTSGGTESINTAVKGIALGAPRGRHIVVTPIEHEATLESADYLARFHGFEVSVAPVDRQGLVDTDALRSLLRDDTTLVSVMAANNEIGTVQDTATIGRLARDRGALLHVDAVQAAGWLDVSAAALGADAISVSGHKLGAPKGVGALYVRGRIRLEPLLHGGGQERGRRSGTENVAAAVGLAAAVELSSVEREPRAAATTRIRDAFVARVMDEVPRAVALGSPEHRLPSIASFLFPGTSGESVLLALEERGIVVSSGSACAAGSDEASHVLLALGIDEALARTAVRFSLDHGTTEADLSAAVVALRESIDQVSGLASS